MVGEGLAVGAEALEDGGGVRRRAGQLAAGGLDHAVVETAAGFGADVRGRHEHGDHVLVEHRRVGAGRAFDQGAVDLGLAGGAPPKTYRWTRIGVGGAEAGDGHPAAQSAGGAHPALEHAVAVGVLTDTAQHHAGGVHPGRVEAGPARGVAPGFQQGQVVAALDRLEQLQRAVSRALRRHRGGEASAAAVAAVVLEDGGDEVVVVPIEDRRRFGDRVAGHHAPGGADGDGMADGHGGITRCCRRLACSWWTPPRWRSGFGTGRCPRTWPLPCPRSPSPPRHPPWPRSP